MAHFVFTLVSAAAIVLLAYMNHRISRSRLSSKDLAELNRLAAKLQASADKLHRE